MRAQKCQHTVHRDTWAMHQDGRPHYFSSVIMWPEPTMLRVITGGLVVRCTLPDPRILICASALGATVTSALPARNTVTLRADNLPRCARPELSARTVSSSTLPSPVISPDDARVMLSLGGSTWPRSIF